MFQYPVTEIYNTAGERALVFSEEEWAAKLAEGWLADRPEPIKTQQPHSLEPIEVPQTAQRKRNKWQPS